MTASFSRKKTIFIIRLAVILVTAYFMLFLNRGEGNNAWGYVFIAFYLMTNLIVIFISESNFNNDKIFYVFILCDSLLLPAGIYLSGSPGSDLYLVYFLIIALAGMNIRFKYAMANIIVFSGVYGWILYYQGLFSGPLAVNYTFRIPLIIVIPLFCGYLISVRLNDKDNNIREAWERFDQIVQATDVLMSIVGQDGTFLFANQKLSEFHGYQDDISIVGISCLPFYGGSDKTLPMQKIQQVYQDNKAVQFESYDPLGKRWLDHTLSPIRYPETLEVFAVSIISQDITERVEKEKKLQDTVDLLQRTRSQLIQKDKMAALGRMASGIAHEIRNPLEIIYMGVDYIDYNLPDKNPEMTESIEKIYNAIDRANKIIKDILSFSRKSDIKIKNVAVSPLLNEIISMAKHTIQKHDITLDLKYIEESLETSTDRTMLEQVLLNLINNAVDAMKNREKKELVLRAYKQTITQIDYKTGYRRADFFKIGDEMVVVEISDTGSGIAEEDLPKIFEPFFTTKPTDEGTGLGLSLAHMIMDRLSGTIDVKSQVGQGTTFFVKLQPGIVDKRQTMEAEHAGKD